MRSSGFHFCLLSTPVNDLPFPDSLLNVKYVKKKKGEKGFLDKAVDYKWDAAASEADLRHDFRLSATIYSLEFLESEGENPAIFIQGHPTSILGKYLFGRRFEI